MAEDLEAIVRRAQQANLLLQNDLFKEAVRAISDRAMAEFKMCKPNDLEGLRHTRLMYEVTETFISVFTNWVRDGQFAQHKDPKLK